VISKLPKWVEIGAFILALVAGCVNAPTSSHFGNLEITRYSPFSHPRTHSFMVRLFL